MKATFPTLFIVLAAACRIVRASGAAASSPRPPTFLRPVAQPAKPAPAPPVCPECGSAECKDEKAGQPVESDETILTKLEHDWPAMPMVKHDVDFRRSTPESG